MGFYLPLRRHPKAGFRRNQQFVPFIQKIGYSDFMIDSRILISKTVGTFRAGRNHSRGRDNRSKSVNEQAHTSVLTPARAR